MGPYTCVLMPVHVQERGGRERCRQCVYSQSYRNTCPHTCRTETHSDQFQLNNQQQHSKRCRVGLLFSTRTHTLSTYTHLVAPSRCSLMPACHPPRCLIPDSCNIIKQSSQWKGWQTARSLGSERRHGKSASSRSAV